MKFVLLCRRHQEAGLAAPPEYVIGAFRPFVFDKILDLPLIQAAAEVEAEISRLAGIADHPDGFSAVAPRQGFQPGRRQGGMAALQRLDEFPQRGEIAAG